MSEKELWSREATTNCIYALLDAEDMVDSIWLTREEAEGYRDARSYRMEGYTVFGVPAYGAIAKLLAPHMADK